MLENQETKMRLLSMCKGNVEKAKKAYDFVMAESEKSCRCSSTELVDGVYLIKKEGDPVLYTKGCDATNCVAVGIKLGSRSIAVALEDAADGDDVELTENKDTTVYDNYIDNRLDAVADWNGAENTERLKEIGLNSRIKLESGQYIPSVAEMLFIYLHRKKVNEAIIAAGGTSIEGKWYWTSTENSATNAWYLALGNGSLSSSAKVSILNAVRPVSAFNF